MLRFISFYGAYDELKTTELLVDDKIQLQYEKLHQGIIVEKVSRHGKLREIKLHLSNSNYFLQWSSQILSYKLGRLNKS